MQSKVFAPKVLYHSQGNPKNNQETDYRLPGSDISEQSTMSRKKLYGVGEVYGWTLKFGFHSFPMSPNILLWIFKPFNNIKLILSLRAM